MNSKCIKSLIEVFIITCMLLLPTQVQAAEQSSKGVISGSQEFVNTSIPKGAKISSGETVQAPIYQSSSRLVYSLSDLEDILRNEFNNRNASLSVNYYGDTSNLKSDLVNMISDVLGEDDYLKYSLAGYGLNYSGHDNDVIINFSFEYLTTKSQEEFVDSKVSTILEQIITSNMTSDEKEKNIHDYIVKNVQYDTSLTRYSAYNALYEGKTVCQGYALLAYKMLKDAGIENKIISGTADNGYKTESHAWNLVKLNGNWYHLDCTWDDPIPDVKGRALHDYYNLTDRKMELDHSWDHLQYPSAITVYNQPSEEIPVGNPVSIDFSNYKKWNDNSTVLKNKLWSLKFTRAFDESTVNSSNVLVYEEFNGLLYPIKDISITYNESKNIIYVKPTTEYIVGKTYYLIVTQNVLSQDGKAIPRPIVLTFKIHE